MGKTSAAVRNRWNRAHYDKINILIKKGDKEVLQKAAEEEHVSVSRFIVNAVNAIYPGLLATLDDTSKRPKPPEPAQESEPAPEAQESEAEESEEVEEVEEVDT